MKFLTDRTEIAKAINFGKYPVLTIDMTNHKGYGDDYSVGCDVKCEYETRSHGVLYTQGHIYIEKGEVGISNNASCLHSSFGYRDVVDMVHWANVPVVKANQEVVVVYDFKDGCIIEIMKTGKRVDGNCITAITLNHIEEE